jgi:YtkA-like
MKTLNIARAAVAALPGVAFASASLPAHAKIKNYEFQLVQPSVQAGADRIITVRLVDKSTGKPVPDAVIFATRLDMAPDGMQEMVTKVTRCRETSRGPTGSRRISAWPVTGS